MQTHTTRLKHTRKLVANRLGGAGGRIYISQVWNNKRRAEPTYPPAVSLEFGVSIVGHCRWISKARTNMRTRNVVYVGGQWVCMCVCCVWCLILCGSSSSGSQVKRAVKTTTGILSWTSFSQSASVGNCEAMGVVLNMLLLWYTNKTYGGIGRKERWNCASLARRGKFDKDCVWCARLAFATVCILHLSTAHVWSANASFLLRHTHWPSPITVVFKQWTVVLQTFRFTSIRSGRTQLLIYI